jgi:hypothetical protein
MVLRLILPKVLGLCFFNPLAISDALIHQPTCFVTIITSFQQNGVSHWHCDILLDEVRVLFFNLEIYDSWPYTFYLAALLDVSAQQYLF